MKIGIYCQHVLGLGHFFRTLEIAKALAPHEVILITGGREIPVVLDDHIRTVELPGLMMDDNFNGLYSVDPAVSLETVQNRRKKILLEWVGQHRPDVFLVELYPFGRRAFRFELEPVLDHIRQTKMSCRVLCSIRDILVEKNEVQKYESRVVHALNKWFDGVLVHSDPELIRLSATFSQMSMITVPVVYTGFVTPAPDPQKVSDLRRALSVTDDDFLVVASVGSGSVGEKLLKAVVMSYPLLPESGKVFLKIFTGPFMPLADVELIRSLALDDSITVETFCPDFISMVGAADLSISMAGYNTCMNLVAAKTPCLVWPFGQNREQRMRAEQLAEFADMAMIEDRDLVPEHLAGLIHDRLNRPGKLEQKKQLNIKGASRTAEWITNQCQS